MDWEFGLRKLQQEAVYPFFGTLLGWMIMTRWHVDDPMGRWLEKFPETKVLSYAAVAGEDDWSVVEGYRGVNEALFPELKPIDFLMERKRRSFHGCTFEFELPTSVGVLRSSR